MAAKFLPFSPANHESFEQRFMFQCTGCKAVFARAPESGFRGPACYICSRRTAHISCDNKSAVPGLHVCYCCNVCHRHWSTDAVAPVDKQLCPDCGTKNRAKLLMPSTVVGAWITDQVRCRQVCDQKIDDAWLYKMIAEHQFDAQFKGDAEYILWCTEHDKSLGGLPPTDVRMRAMALIWSRLTQRPVSEFEEARVQCLQWFREKGENREAARQWEATKKMRMCDFCSELAEKTQVRACPNGRGVHLSWLHACDVCFVQSKTRRVVCANCRDDYSGGRAALAAKPTDNL
jgi:hypothetical protein